MKLKSKMLLLILPVISLLLLNTACTKEIKDPVVLRFVIPNDPVSLEPGISYLMYDSLVAHNLNAGLFVYDKDSKVTPYQV